MELVGEVIGGAVKNAIVVRGSEVLAGAAREGSAKLSSIGGATPTFSVGATTVIALTSFACGGLAGWALKEMFSRGER